MGEYDEKALFDKIDRIAARPGWRSRQPGPSVGDGANVTPVVPDQNRRTAEDNKEAGPRFPLYNKGPERADIVILVATQEELRQLGKAWPLSWSNAGDREFSYSFAKTELCGYEITVVKAKQGRMGMVDAATLTTQAIHALSPKLIAMTGICAGVGGDVSRGDLIVAAQAYDYGSGKLFPEGPQPDYNFVPMNATLGGDLEQFWETNEEALRKVQDAWPGGNTGKPPTMLRAHAGNIGSGAGVLAKSAAEPQHGGVPEPRHEMIPSEGIAVEEGGQDDVRGREQSQRQPHLAARNAGTEEQQRSANRGKGEGVRQESDGNGEDDK